MQLSFGIRFEPWVISEAGSNLTVCLEITRKGLASNEAKPFQLFLCLRGDFNRIRTVCHKLQSPS